MSIPDSIEEQKPKNENDINVIRKLIIEDNIKRLKENYSPIKEIQDKYLSKIEISNTLLYLGLMGIVTFSYQTYSKRKSNRLIYPISLTASIVISSVSYFFQKKSEERFIQALSIDKSEYSFYYEFYKLIKINHKNDYNPKIKGI